MMITSHKSPATKLGKILPTAALALGLAFSAQAATATANPTLSQSKPVFLGDGGDYPFSSAVRVGDTLYMSGQIGFKDGKLVEGGIKAEAKQSLDNINGVLLQYGYQKSDLVKCMAMLTDMGDFDDFNEVYKAELSKPYPVRSAFGVADLAANASVEIECIAAK
ncbi:RidA family protein [Psychrobacter sp. 2Y5]|uniref:RidA family protein n=2 Tax=Psychrobacter TaxID=497 RepID=UPI003F447D42